MRRRLDLASSVILPPKLLFLDEPTTGLDPRTRNEMWEVIRELVGEGTTLLLTTQYLEEADQLANRIVVIDEGRIIADGTGDELKAAAGGITVEILLNDSGDIPVACAALQSVGLSAHGVSAPTADLEVPTTSDAGLQTVQQVAGALQGARIGVNDMGLRRASLDEVFLQLTNTERPSGRRASPRRGDTMTATTGRQLLSTEAIEQRPRTGVTAALADGWTIGKRNLKHFTRSATTAGLLDDPAGHVRAAVRLHL